MSRSCPVHVLSVWLACAAATHAQTMQTRIDLGGTTYPTGLIGGEYWNDIDPGNTSSSIALVDTGGSLTGAVLDFTPGREFQSSNNAGVINPTPGSPLDGLGWPSSALRDTLYSRSSRPLIEFTLSGLDPAENHDFTIVASRLGVSDNRSCAFFFSGIQQRTVVLDASDNTTDFVQVPGILPSASGQILVQIQADRINDNPSGFFYFNALGIDAHAAGSQAPLVAFGRNRLDFSRQSGRGPFNTTMTTFSNDLSTPTISLSAVDHNTGLAPTWLSLPASVTAGSGFPVTVDEATLGPGLVSATVLGQASGYASDMLLGNLTVRPLDGAWNLLFYGNSYSMGNAGVHELIQAIAEEANWQPPNIVGRLSGGKDLEYHRTDPGQVAAITDALPLGEAWDVMIMQGHSLEATFPLGDPSGFRADALAIISNVRAHSPECRTVMFQTWARATGHSFYAGANPTFQGPLDMHGQIAQNYTLAVADINQALGPDTARRAAVGEALALNAWDASLYTGDRSHPGPSMTLMAGMAIYSAIYQRNVCDIRPDFKGNSTLAAKLTGWGISPQRWLQLAGFADRVAPNSQRVYPGSSDDFYLAAGTPDLLTLCPIQAAPNGRPLVLDVQTPAATKVGQPVFLYADPFHPGFPPGVSGRYHDLQFDPLGFFLLWMHPQMPAGGIQFPTTVPPLPPGTSLMLQAVVLSPSLVTGNPHHTTSDGHEIRY